MNHLEKLNRFLRCLLLISFLLSLVLIKSCAPKEEDELNKSSNSEEITDESTPSGESILFSGVVAQGYVKDATLFADYNGNIIKDAGEPSVITNSDGSFELSAVSGNWNIVSVGGIDIVTEKSALPMSAPRPEKSGEVSNVTPLTSLVAANPELKNKLDELGGWNSDIANSAGVSGKLMRIAHTVEQSLKVISQGDNAIITNNSAKLLVVGKLANELSAKPINEMTSDESLQDVSTKGILAAFNDENVLNTLSSSEKNSIKLIKGEVANAVSTAVKKMTYEIANTNIKINEATFKDKLDEAVKDVSSTISDAKNLVANPKYAVYCGNSNENSCDDNGSNYISPPKFGYVVFN